MPTPTQVNPKHIFLSPLCTYERNGWLNYGLFVWMLQYTKPYAARGWQITLAPAYNFNPAPAARNAAGRAMLGTDAEWLLMVDNDICPPPHLLDMLEEAGPEQDIVVPVMHMWDNESAQSVLVWRTWRPGDKFEPVRAGEKQRYERGELADATWVELTFGGSGCIAIRRRVLEGMPYPWFQYEYDENYLLASSEDVYFTGRARAKGFRMWGYTKATCSHFHTTDLALIPPRLEPLEVPQPTEPGPPAQEALPFPAEAPQCSP